MKLKPSKLTKLFTTCDPGTGGTGLATFNGTDNVPVNTLLIHPKAGEHWRRKAFIIAANVDKYFSQYSPETNHLIIEKPKFMNSRKGKITAQSESLFKLIFVYSIIYITVFNKGFKVEDLEIITWKGQLDKNKVDYRIKRLIGMDFPEHVSDAVGMGLYLKGLYGNGKR